MNGTDIVAKSAPDGYTILLSVSGQRHFAYVARAVILSRKT